MRAWTEDDLTRIGGSVELQIASRWPDGTLRPYVTIWVVRAGDDLYVRSAYGSTNPCSGAPRPAAPDASAPAASNATSPSPRPPRTATATSTRPTTPSTTATDRRSSEPSPAPRPHRWTIRLLR